MSFEDINHQLRQNTAELRKLNTQHAKDKFDGIAHSVKVMIGNVASMQQFSGITNDQPMTSFASGIQHDRHTAESVHQNLQAVTQGTSRREQAEAITSYSEAVVREHDEMAHHYGTVATNLDEIIVVLSSLQTLLSETHAAACAGADSAEVAMTAVQATDSEVERFIGGH